MRIALSVLVGLMICAAAAAGIHYYGVAQSPAVTATPQTEQTVVNSAAPLQAVQKTVATPAMEQPVITPIPPAPPPPRIVKTESIAPLPDDAASTMAQQGNTTPANAHMKKAKKHKKHVARPKKRPLKTTPVAPTR